MQALVKLLMVSLLVAPTGLAMDFPPKKADSIKFALSQAQIQTVQVRLSALSRVLLKSGASKKGSLRGINSQTLLLEGESIPVSRVKKVVFLDDDPSSTRGELPPPIRGERRSWHGVPLRNFKVQDSGWAEVGLPPQVDSKVGKERGYVYHVMELSFPAGNTLNLEIEVIK